MAKPTIAAGFPNAFLEFAISRGADRQGLIERSQIRPGELRNHDTRIPLSKYLALMKAGIELCNEPALALLFGEAVRLEDMSILGLIGRMAKDPQSANREMNRYACLAMDDDDGDTSDRLQFVRENRDLWLKFTSDIYVSHPLITESTFARCICGGRAAFESSGISMKAPFPKAIRFTYEEPRYRAEYDRIFGVPLSFSSNMNALLMDDEILSIKLPRPNPYLSEVLRGHAEELLKDLERSRSIRGRVEGLLIPILHTGNAGIDVIASKLGLSRQTLFRRLKADGVTFEEVVDELRHKLALHYLMGKKVSVSETAYLLGFSEPAAFSRAFKRWTGSRPRTLRLKK